MSNRDQTKLGTTWADVEGLIKQRAFPKWAGRVLAGLVIIVLVLIGFGIWNGNRITSLVNQNHTLVQQVRSGALQSCEAGNRARTTNKLIWDDFLTLLVTNPETARTRTQLLQEVYALGLPTDVRTGLDDIIDASWTTSPSSVALVNGFKAYIASHEFPVNCAKVYK